MHTTGHVKLDNEVDKARAYIVCYECYAEPFLALLLVSHFDLPWSIKSASSESLRLAPGGITKGVCRGTVFNASS